MTHLIKLELKKFGIAQNIIFILYYSRLCRVKWLKAT